MIDHWILDENGEPKPVSLMEWAKWFEDVKHRIVDNTQVGIFEVSTVFLGLDHGWGQGPPVLWETMIFCGEPGDERPLSQSEHPLHLSSWRYTSKHDALVGHARAVELALAASQKQT